MRGPSLAEIISASLRLSIPMLAAKRPTIQCIRALADFDPRQFVLVVEEVTQLRARNGRETASGVVIGLALEFDRADKISAAACGQPALDERK